MEVFEPQDHIQPLWVILKVPLEGSEHQQFEVVMYLVRNHSHQASSNPQHIGYYASLELARTSIPKYAIHAPSSEGDPAEVVESWV